MSKTEGYTHPDHVVSCKPEVKMDPGGALRYACSRIYWKKLRVLFVNQEQLLRVTYWVTNNDVMIVTLLNKIFYTF